MAADRDPPSQPAQADKRQRGIVVALACLIALVMIGLGLLSIFSGEHSGTTRFSGTVFFEGSRARWMGAFQACLGMTALALAMKTRRAALRWMGLWMLCAALAFVMGWRSA